MKKLIYEYPLSEHILICLQFEKLINNINKQLDFEDNHYVCLNLITQLILMLEKPDLRFKFSQELHRTKQYFKTLQSNPNIDKDQLQKILDKLSKFQIDLHHSSGSLVSCLKKNEVLKSCIKLYKSVTGICQYQDPLIYNWLKQNPENRLNDLKFWLQDLEKINNLIKFILSLLRSSLNFNHLIADMNLYQQALNVNKNYRLVHIKISDENIYPKISMGQHGLSIKFIHNNNSSSKNVDFELAYV